LKQRKNNFALGLIFYTLGAIHASRQSGGDPLKLPARHATGNWGALDVYDRRENQTALQRGGRIFSAYALGDGTEIWAISEADRSATTILLPSKY